MLGFGHSPPFLLDALATPQVQANVMTASFSQVAFQDALRKEIGHSRPKQVCPYESFICLNRYYAICVCVLMVMFMIEARHVWVLLCLPGPCFPLRCVIGNFPE
jgi:hypothetical protein